MITTHQPKSDSHCCPDQTPDIDSIVLVEHAELAAGVARVARVHVDASVKKVAVEVRHQRTDVAATVRTLPCGRWWGGEGSSAAFKGDGQRRATEGTHRPPSSAVVTKSRTQPTCLCLRIGGLDPINVGLHVVVPVRPVALVHREALDPVCPAAHALWVQKAID